MNEKSFSLDFDDNWSVSTLRHRLAAYLADEQRKHDLHRKRVDTWHRKETGQEHHDRTPTWMTVGLEISSCEACWPYLYDEVEPLSDQTDIPLEQAEPAGEDYGATIRAEALRQFVEGVSARDDTGLTFRKFTRPARNKLNAIAVFLVERGFLSAADLQPPGLIEEDQRIDDVFTQFGYAPTTILPDRFFAGDFQSEETAAGLHRVARLSLHLNDDACEYIADSHSVLFRRHRQERASVFRQRVELGRPDRAVRWTGRGRFREGQPLVIVFSPVSGLESRVSVLLSDVIFWDSNQRVKAFLLRERGTGDTDHNAVTIITEREAWNRAMEASRDDQAVDRFIAVSKKKLLSIQGNDTLMSSDEEQDDAPPDKIRGRFLFRKPDIASGSDALQTELENMPEPQTPELQLRNAVLDADVDRVRDLITAGADVNFAHPDDQLRAIQIAAATGAWYVVETLIEDQNLDLLIKDRENRLPSHLALSVADDPELCDLLLQAELDQANRRGIDYNRVLDARSLESDDPHNDL